MLNKTRIALAAALSLGGAATVLRGEGSPDLSYPPGYDNAASAPRRTAPVSWQGARGHVLENYGWAPQLNERAFTAEEKALFERATGSPDHN